MMTDARGKLGGQVFTKNRSGAVVRTKVTPVNPQSVPQSIARATLGGNSSAWANLTEEQRLSWIAGADSIIKTNIFGDTYKPSGKNYFVSVNSNLKLASKPILNSAPEAVAPDQITSLTAEYDKLAETLKLTVVLQNGDPDTTVIVKATRPASAGKYNFSGQYVVIDTFPGDSPSTPLELGIAYSSKYGSPAVGSKIGFEVYAISSTGVAGPPSKTTAIVLT